MLAGSCHELSPLPGPTTNPKYFPLRTIQIEASYEHITRQKFEAVLAAYSNESFFSVRTQALSDALSALEWTESVQVQRAWPDALKLTLTEKTPIAVWNNSYVSSNYTLFEQGKVKLGQFDGPYLYGPTEQATEVLQTYKKLSKLLTMYGLNAASLTLRENQAWEIMLTNGVQLKLGRQNLEARLKRFCRAYPAVFGEKPELLSSVDLRYPNGMAAQWKQPVQRSRK